MSGDKQVVSPPCLVTTVVARLTSGNKHPCTRKAVTNIKLLSLHLNLLSNV